MKWILSKATSVSVYRTNEITDQHDRTPSAHPSPIPATRSGPAHPERKVTESQNEPERTGLRGTVLLTSTALTASLFYQPTQLLLLREKVKENKIACIQVKKVLPVVSAEMQIHLLSFRDQYASCGPSHSHGNRMKGLEMSLAEALEKDAQGLSSLPGSSVHTHKRATANQKAQQEQQLSL